MTRLANNPRCFWWFGFATAPLWGAVALLAYRSIAAIPEPSHVGVGMKTDASQSLPSSISTRSLETYRAIWSRSLRQRLIEPPKPPEPVVTDQNRGVNLSLLGTAVEGARSFAMLRLDQGGVVMAEIGSPIESFVVHTITADRVGLSRDGTVTYVTLPEPLRRWLPKSAFDFSAEASTTVIEDKSESITPQAGSAQDPLPVLATIEIHDLTTNELMEDTRLLPAQNGPGRQRGFRIDSINDSSKLKQSGLRPGDVITAIGNQTLTRLADLETICGKLDAAVTHQWRVERAGRWFDVNLIFTETQPNDSTY